MHNVVITDVAKDGVSVLPLRTNVGYDLPRNYLPRAIIDLLDAADMDDEPPDP